MRHEFKSIEHSVGTLTQIILVCVFVVGPLGLSGRPMMSSNHNLASDASAIEKAKFQTLMIADNHDGSQTEPTSNAEQEQPASDGQKDSRPHSKPDQKVTKRPLKPFNPSERIKADQAVDFPSDI